MPQAYTHSFSKTAQVTAVGVNQVFPLISVRKGDIVVATSLRRTILAAASSDSTLQFALNSAGLVLGATIDPETTPVGSIAGSSVNMYRVPADDTVELRYLWGTSTGAAPAVKTNVLVLRNRGDI